MTRTYQDLAYVVEGASEKYTNATALFQWAKERGSCPPTAHTYENVVSTYGGSCLEQLKSVVMAGFPLQYLRSIRRTDDGRRSIHHAGMCEVNGEECLVDPNLSSVPVPLSEVRARGEVAVESFPAVGEQRTRFIVRSAGEGKVAVSQVRNGKEWRSESFDLRERCAKLPNVDIDVLSPLAHRMIILQVALPLEGTDREVVRIQRDCVRMGVKLLAQGKKLPKPEMEKCLDRVTSVLSTTREDLMTFLREGYALLDHLQSQRQELEESARRGGWG